MLPATIYFPRPDSPDQLARQHSPEMLQPGLEQLEQPAAAAAVHATLLESLAAAVADQKHFQLLDLAAVAAAAAATASGQGHNAGQ